MIYDTQRTVVYLFRPVAWCHLQGLWPERFLSRDMDMSGNAYRLRSLSELHLHQTNDVSLIVVNEKRNYAGLIWHCCHSDYVCYSCSC